jgi:hypothetical protein
MRLVTLTAVVVLGALAGAFILRTAGPRHQPVRTAGDPFSRRATAEDRLPAWLTLSRERVLASRRVRVYQAANRSATLYVARTASRAFCTVLVANRAAAVGCSDTSWSRGISYGLNYAFGIAGEDAVSIVVTGTSGRAYHIPVGPLGAFILRCRASTGCGASVRSVAAYDAGGRFVWGA